MEEKINEIKKHILLYKKDKDYHSPNTELKKVDISHITSITPTEKAILEKKLKEYEESLLSYYFHCIQNCLNLNSRYNVYTFENTINLLSLGLNDPVLNPMKREYMEYIAYLITNQIKQYPEVNEFGITNLRVFATPSKVLGEYYTLIKEDYSKVYHKNIDSKIMTYTLWTKMDARKIMK